MPITTGGINCLRDAKEGEEVWFNEFDNIYHGFVGRLVDKENGLVLGPPVRMITMDNGTVSPKSIYTPIFTSKSEAKEKLIETLQNLVDKTEEEIRSLHLVVDKYNERIKNIKKN